MATLEVELDSGYPESVFRANPDFRVAWQAARSIDCPGTSHDEHAQLVEYWNGLYRYVKSRRVKWRSFANNGSRLDGIMTFRGVDRSNSDARCPGADSADSSNHYRLDEC
jgi:hypothetical protein